MCLESGGKTPKGDSKDMPNLSGTKLVTNFVSDNMMFINI
jgi:hypothetical protein